jgi:hypothetical protein
MAIRAPASRFRKHPTIHEVSFIRTMRIMTINTRHLTGVYRMMMGQSELTLYLNMTPQTTLGRTSGIVNQMAPTPFHGMQTPWTMTGLAARSQSIIIVNDQPRMNRALHPAMEFLVAQAAVLGTHKIRARNLRYHDNRPVDTLTGSKPSQKRHARNRQPQASRFTPPTGNQLKHSLHPNVPYQAQFRALSPKHRY